MKTLAIIAAWAMMSLCAPAGSFQDVTSLRDTIPHIHPIHRGELTWPDGHPSFYRHAEWKLDTPVVDTLSHYAGRFRLSNDSLYHMPYPPTKTFYRILIYNETGVIAHQKDGQDLVVIDTMATIRALIKALEK